MGLKIRILHKYGLLYKTEKEGTCNSQNDVGRLLYTNVQDTSKYWRIKTWFWCFFVKSRENKHGLLLKSINISWINIIILTWACHLLCISAVSLLRQRHDILDFSYCPLSSALHVTLANWQRFGFQFHLRSSPSASSAFVKIIDQLNTSQLATPCWRDPTRSKQPSTVAIWLSVWTLSCRCPVKLSM